MLLNCRSPKCTGYLGLALAEVCAELVAGLLRILDGVLVLSYMFRYVTVSSSE